MAAWALAPKNATAMVIKPVHIGGAAGRHPTYSESSISSWGGGRNAKQAKSTAAMVS